MEEVVRRVLLLEGRVGALETVERPGLVVPFVGVAGAAPYGADGTLFRAGVWRDLRLRLLVVAVQVAAPNDGGNFWTVRLRGGTGGTLAQVESSGVAAGTWGRLVTTSFSAAVVAAASESVLEIDVVATGSPGGVGVVPVLVV